MLLCCSLQTFPWWSFRWVFAPPLLLAPVREADDVVGPDCWCGSQGLELGRVAGDSLGDRRGPATDGRAGTASPGAAPAVWSLLQNTLTFIRSFSQISFFSFHLLLHPLCCPLNFSLTWLPPYNPQFNHSPLLFLLRRCCNFCKSLSALSVSHILSFLSQSSSFILTHERSL